MKRAGIWYSRVMTLGDAELVYLIKAGKVGVIPTDTVYGLACAAANQGAVERLYKLKDREQKPGTIIAASIEQLVELGIKARYLKPVAQYWPNSISIIIPNHGLSYIHQGQGGIAIRLPAKKDLQTLLEKAGPLLTTSANHPGEPTAVTIQEAREYFGDKLDFYVDGGDLSGRPASTLIRILDDAAEVLREGAVKINEAGEIEK